MLFRSDNATNENEAATAHAAENDVISKLGKNDQTKGFKLIKNRVEDLFEGEQAIKYSKALSDQIPNCDKSNQLDMHNEIMKSKYSEVHAKTDEEGYALLKAFGLPFKNAKKD